MRLALLAAAATGVQVGAALVASEAVVAEVGAGRLGLLRYAIALLLLLPIALRTHGPAIPARELGPVALIGMSQFGILIALLNLAVLHTDSARVALVFATLPMLTVAVARVLTGQRITRRAFAATVLSVLGVAVLLGESTMSGGLDRSDLTGIGYAGLATLTGAICSSLYGPYLKRHGIVRTSAIAMAASLAPLAVISWADGAGNSWLAWSGSTHALNAFIGLSSALGLLLWLYALARAPAGSVTAFLALSPVTAAGLSVLWFGAEIEPGTGLALVLVVCGLAVLAIEARPERHDGCPGLEEQSGAPGKTSASPKNAEN